MRIAVFGAGAIGCAVAAALVQAGRDVQLVARGAMLSALNAGPLRIASDGRVEDVRVCAIAADSMQHPVDLAVCCVKTPDLETALTSIRSTLAPGGTLVTLQNGVEAHETAARLIPEADVVAGRVHGFFEMRGQVVHHVGVPPSILAGCVAGDAVRAEQALVAAFAGSTIPVTVAHDIRRSIWDKFLLAASMGTVSVALNVPAGMVLSHPDGPRLLRYAITEVAELAGAYGISFDEPDVQRIMDFVGRFPPDATTSLQRDISAGRTSEYDALTGAVLRMGRERGIPHPTFVELDQAIRARWTS